MGLSFLVRDPVDAFIIFFIVPVSGLLGFWQDRGASNAVEKLLSIVQIKSAVLRDGSSKEIPVEEIVPGDIVILNAGDIVPGDALVQESNDLFIDEAMLTGETFPVEKVVAVLPAETPLGQRTKRSLDGNPCGERQRNGADYSHRQGNRVRPSVRATKNSDRRKRNLNAASRKFGYFLMEVTLVLVVAIFAINVYLAATSPGLISVFPGTCRWANLAIASRDLSAALDFRIHYIF